MLKTIYKTKEFCLFANISRAISVASDSFPLIMSHICDNIISSSMDKVMLFYAHYIKSMINSLITEIKLIHTQLSLCIFIINLAYIMR